jgi:hypothetical protein
MAMTEFSLLRVSVSAYGAFGVMMLLGVPFAVTLEHTYGDPPRPKIPAGEFKMRLSKFYRGGYDTYEVIVPGHSRILIHKANLPEELDGCIGIGESFNPVNGKPGITSSAMGFMEFMRLTRNRPELDLSVREIRWSV